MISGMVYGDLHIHSIYSNGYFGGFPPWVASTPREILEKAKERGLKIIAVTDHDCLEGSRQAEKMAKDFGIIVIPGCEVSTIDGHLLAYGVNKEIPKNLKAEEAVRLIHQQGGLAIAAHPFKPAFIHNLPINHSLGEKVFQLPIDGLEIINSNTPRSFESLAKMALKKKPGFIQVGGSDTHVLDFVGDGLTVFDKEINTAQEALEMMKVCKTKTELRRRTSWGKLIWYLFRDQFRFLFKRVRLLRLSQEAKE